MGRTTKSLGTSVVRLRNNFNGDKILSTPRNTRIGSLGQKLHNGIVFSPRFNSLYYNVARPVKKDGRKTYGQAGTSSIL